MSTTLSERLEQLISGQGGSLSVVDRDLKSLVELASDLGGLPRQQFRNHLKEDLQRRAKAMVSTPKTWKVKGLREGFHTVTPYLSVREALEVIDFVKRVFGAEGAVLGTGSQGGIHSEFKIGDSIIMIGGGSSWKGTSRPAALHCYVDDVDAVYKRALEAGATSMQEPIEDYGERVAGVKDVAGNEWYIARRLEGSHTSEGLRSVNPYLHPKGTNEFIAFLKQAFAAEEVAVYRSPNGVVQHAKIRIGDSVIEMGEAHGQYQPLESTFLLYVDDVDAWYARAVRAGASSINEPADAPYGDRVGAVSDSSGNIWYIATPMQKVA